MTGLAVVGLLVVGYSLGVATILLLRGLLGGPDVVVYHAADPDREADFVAWLRHPIHTVRCACGRYGVEDGIVVRDHDADHASTHCQPAHERLED